MSEEQDPVPPGRGEDDEDQGSRRNDEEEQDETIREGAARDNELEHAIDDGEE
jgi:hypothetical protein